MPTEVSVSPPPAGPEEGAPPGPPNPDATYDLLILGGGPSAMTAAVYAARKYLRLALLTRDFGGQMGFTSDIENYMGFRSITGYDLTARFQEHVAAFRIPVGEGLGIERVWREGDLLFARTEGGTTFHSLAVILATGARPRELGVPGEREFYGRGVSVCATCDAPLYRDRRVVVAGGGNSAFTAALDLLKVAREVTLVNVAPGWQADPILQEAVRRYPNVRLLDRHRMKEIRGEAVVTEVVVEDLVGGGGAVLPADGVFVEIGWMPNSGPVRGVAALNRRGEVVIDERCRTSVPGLFAAGDVTAVPYKQIIIAAGEGAKAALAAHEYLASGGKL